VDYIRKKNGGFLSQAVFLEAAVGFIGNAIFDEVGGE
jgi:hypothetical protein